MVSNKTNLKQAVGLVVIFTTLLFLNNYKEYAITILMGVVISRVPKIGTRIDVGSVALALPFIISLAQLFAVSAVGILNIPPLGLTNNRQALFTVDAVYTVWFCTCIQSLIMSMLLGNHNVIQFKFVYLSSIQIILLTAVSWFLADRSNDNSFVYIEAYSSASSILRENTWGGWIGLYVIAASILVLQLPNQKNQFFCIVIAITIFLQIIYFLLHGNRSEVLIQSIIGPLVFFYGRKSFLQPFYISFKTLVFVLLVIIGFYIIGEIRDGLEEIQDPFSGFDSLYFSTLSGTMWSQIVVVSKFSVMGSEFGRTYFDHVKNIIPSFVPTPWERAPEAVSYISDGDVVGGMGFWGEAFLNYGVLGVIGYSLVFIIIYERLVKRASRSGIDSILVMSIVIYLPRIFMYDFVYLFKMVVLFVAVHLFRFVFKFRGVN